MADSRLTVHFEESGRDESTRILGWSINAAYLTSTDGFEFDILPDTSIVDFRDLELQPVELLVQNGSGANCSQLLGRIDRTSLGGQGSVVSCSGRDYLADLVECNVDPTFLVKEGMSVGDALTLVCQPCGIDTIVTDDDIALENIRTGHDPIKSRAKKKKNAVPLQDLQPRQGGEGIYEFCNRIAARHGATIQPGNARNVLQLNPPDFKQDPQYAIRVSASGKGSKNNVVTATAERDYSRFPTYVLAYGKQGGRSDEKAGALRKTFDVLTLAQQYSPEMSRILKSARIVGGRSIPGRGGQKAGPLYRLLVVTDRDARTDDQLMFAAQRALAERLKDTLSYRVTLRGHFDVDSGAIWTVNTMVRVTDEIRGIDEPLWIAERTLAYSTDNGATTELVCWRPDSFVIDPG